MDAPDKDKEEEEVKDSSIESYKRVEQSLTQSSFTKDKLEQMNGVIKLKNKNKGTALVQTKNEGWSLLSSHYCQLLWGRLISYVQPSLNTHFSGSEILERLWISDFASTCNLTSLQDRNIRYVVVCFLGLQPVFPKHINYLQVPLIDKETQDVYQFFDMVADHINNVSARFVQMFGVC